jgi:DNA-binding LytR/AlgR family response regulator
MSKFIELTFTGEGNRKTLVNIDRVDNVYTDFKGLVNLTFSDGKVTVSESYETVKQLINKAI